MDVHYIALSDKDLQQAMDKYTTWLDNHL